LAVVRDELRGRKPVDQRARKREGALNGV
jgi:hypothetical protein